MSVKASFNTFKKMNDKMYPKLSTDERFKMVIKAFVNGNEVQCEKLVKSCPQFTYLKSAHSYTEGIEASRDIVTVFIIQLLEYDKIISLLKILNGLLYRTRSQVKTEKKLVSEVQAFLLAFETFCWEYLGLKSEDMIQAWYGYDARYIKKIEKIKEMIDIYQTDLDSELKEIWLKRVFLNAWQARVES
ncbi:hypothetical protein [Peribacillus muralis]|uniref:hypothetical protein n=1 Tax=Peribacillus muralis TaxID=264697 RepID=UPI003D07C72A